MKKKLVGQRQTAKISVIGTEEASIATFSVEIELPDGSTQHVTAHGTARKDPIDKFNEEIAVKLAIARALGRASRLLEKQANGLVKSIDDNRNRHADSAKQFDVFVSSSKANPDSKSSDETGEPVTAAAKNASLARRFRKK